MLSYDDLRPKGIKLTKVSLWRMVKAGRFPKPVKIGNENAWPEPEIDRYLEDLMAARDVAKAADTTA